MLQTCCNVVGKTSSGSLGGMGARGGRTGLSATSGNRMPAAARALPGRRDRATVRPSASSPTSHHDDAFTSQQRPVIIEEARCELLGNEGGKYSLVGEMVVNSDADSMYNMLTDYAASPRIFSTVDSVETGRLDDGRLLVSQSCRWKFLVFGGAFPCQLAVAETPEERYMEVALHKKGFIREFEGSWKVTEEPTGGVRVRHTLALRPGLTPPYAHKIFLRQIGEILEDVQKEAGGSAAAARRVVHSYIHPTLIS